MTLNENIRALRIDAGLSQDELASRLGVSRQSVSKWETGSATPELEKLTAMSGLFGVTLDELVYGMREAEAENAAALERDKQTGTPKARYVAGLVLVIVGGVIAIGLMLLGVTACQGRHSGVRRLYCAELPVLRPGGIWSSGVSFQCTRRFSYILRLAPGLVSTT